MPVTRRLTTVHVQRPLSHRDVVLPQVYALALVFLTWLLLMLTSVFSAVWKPLPVRAAEHAAEESLYER